MDNKIRRGQILRQLRLKRQLTQNEAAENFGISQQTYQKYESGKTEANYDLLCDFATFYNVSVDYLLGREEQKNPLLEMAVKPINDDEMWEAYDRLPDIAKEIFVEVMEVLSKASRKKEKDSKEKEINQNVYPVPTLARGKKGVSVEYMTEDEINDILSAEDADEDL